MAALVGVVSGGEIDVLMPGSDASLLDISRARARLEAHVRLGLPAADDVWRALDKAELYEAAARHGLTPPPTVLCREIERRWAPAPQLGYPVVVKPRRSVIETESPRRHSGSLLAATPAELSAIVDLLGGDVLVQRRAAGALVSFGGVFAGGGLLAEAVSRYGRTWHPSAGNASFSETIDGSPELRSRVCALLADLGWEGLFELELIEREDGGLARDRHEPEAIRIDGAGDRRRMQSARDLVPAPARRPGARDPGRSVRALPLDRCRPAPRAVAAAGRPSGGRRPDPEPAPACGARVRAPGRPRPRSCPNGGDGHGGGGTHAKRAWRANLIAKVRPHGDHRRGALRPSGGRPPARARRRRTRVRRAARVLVPADAGGHAAALAPTLVQHRRPASGADDRRLRARRGPRAAITVAHARAVHRLRALVRAPDRPRHRPPTRQCGGARRRRLSPASGRRRGAGRVSGHRGGGAGPVQIPPRAVGVAARIADVARL